MKGNIFSQPYMISNAVAVMVLVITIIKPLAGRMIISLLFIAAAFINGIIAISHPELYRVYGDLAALRIYEDFINGFFGRHITGFVLTIAVLQLITGLGLVWRGWIERAALAGAIIFLLAIAPLGAGAAFPCTVLLAVACGILFRERHIRPWPEQLLGRADANHHAL